MDERAILASQYRAALHMLEQAIVRCPDALWARPDPRNRYWQIAYHALFYTHLYLQDSVAAFTAWPKHREEYLAAEPPAEPLAPDRATVLEYLGYCERQVADRLAHMDLDAASGFEWLPFSRRELQLYTIRHIQQHVGELTERLGDREGVAVDWVGVGRRP